MLAIHHPTVIFGTFLLNALHLQFESSAIVNLFIYTWFCCRLSIFDIFLLFLSSSWVLNGFLSLVLLNFTLSFLLIHINVVCLWKSLMDFDFVIAVAVVVVVVVYWRTRPLLFFRLSVLNFGAIKNNNNNETWKNKFKDNVWFFLLFLKTSSFPLSSRSRNFYFCKKKNKIQSNFFSSVHRRLSCLVRFCLNFCFVLILDAQEKTHTTSDVVTRSHKYIVDINWDLK